MCCGEAAGNVAGAHRPSCGGHVLRRLSGCFRCIDAFCSQGVGFAISAHPIRRCFGAAADRKHREQPVRSDEWLKRSEHTNNGRFNEPSGDVFGRIRNRESVPYNADGCGRRFALRDRNDFYGIAEVVTVVHFPVVEEFGKLLGTEGIAGLEQVLRGEFRIFTLIGGKVVDSGRRKDLNLMVAKRLGPDWHVVGARQVSVQMIMRL